MDEGARGAFIRNFSGCKNDWNENTLRLVSRRAINRLSNPHNGCTCEAGGGSQTGRVLKTVPLGVNQCASN